MMRNQILLLFAAFFFVLCGFCFGIALFAHMQGAEIFSVNSSVWWIFTFVPLGAGLVFLFFSSPEAKKVKELANVERFMTETQKAIRGHLKLSILFWILVYRKEKVKSIEDAKKEIFQEVRREIPREAWVEEVISEIQVALSRYK
jgi:hypothetical protein